jgi:hypothetical protein
MHPGKTWKHSEGDNKSLLKVSEKNYKRPWKARYEVEAKKESSSFQVLLNTKLTYGKEKTWWLPRVGGHGGSWAEVEVVW